MDLTQLSKLGISLPPAKAFSVELSPHEREIIAFWLMNRVAGGRAVSRVQTVAKTVTSTAAHLLEASEFPRPVVIQNNSTTLNVWIAFNAVATTGMGIMIPPLGYYESPFDLTEYVSAISTGSANLTLVTAVR